MAASRTNPQWKLPQFQAGAPGKLTVDTDLVAVFQDSAKKAIPGKSAYSSVIERFRKDESFVGRSGSVQYIRFSGKNSAENVEFVGLGAPGDLTVEKARVAGANAWGRLRAEKSKAVAVQVESFLDAKGLRSELTPAALLRAFAEGMILSAYQYEKHKSHGDAKEAPSVGPSRVTFVTKDSSLKTQLDRELAKVAAIGESVRVTRDWSNEPSNFGTPEYYANEARKLAREYGLKVKVLTERDAAREKMGLFLAVGRGAENEGRIVVVEYNPKGVRSPKTLAYVGKGVTFDSGGISIKPSMRMEDMKHDMTGAATVMGSVILASLWKVPTRVVGVMAFTENLPSGTAIHPGNVIRSRSGKTVEVINTDAEGRLILADALDFAQDYKPDAVVNVATLTGAVTIALGKKCCAIMSNNDILTEALKRAGDACGEKIWELPCSDDYFEDLKSEYADMKNVANDSYGGAIRGGVFLKQFIRKGMPWAHLDIAGTAYDLGYLPYFPKRGASGAHVRTLAQFAADF